MNRNEFLKLALLAPIGIRIGPNIEPSTPVEQSAVPKIEGLKAVKNLPDWIKNIPVNYTEKSGIEFIPKHINVGKMVLREDRPAYHFFISYKDDREYFARNVDIFKIDFLANYRNINGFIESVTETAVKKIRFDIADYYEAWVETSM